MAKLLAVEDLAVTYRLGDALVHAVDGVDLALAEGAMLGLVGESGCGITRGRVLLAGTDLVSLTGTEHRARLWRDLSFVPQSAMNALDPVYRLRDQMREVLCRRGGLSRGAADARSAELFRTVGLDPRRLMDYPHQFSGGMRQRAAIAMALALRPKLVIADEPVTALDVIVQRQVLDTIRGLGRELGLSAIIVTHDISVVAYLCSMIAVMYAGRIVEYGPIERVMGEPAHPYTMGLMNASPDLARAGAELTPIEGSPPSLVHPPIGCRFAARCPFAERACAEAMPATIDVAPDHSAACIRTGDAGELRRRSREAATWRQ
jgi:peptide/nickel transport system ATP-binding protein